VKKETTVPFIFSEKGKGRKGKLEKLKNKDLKFHTELSVAGRVCTYSGGGEGGKEDVGKRRGMSLNQHTWKVKTIEKRELKRSRLFHFDGKERKGDLTSLNDCCRREKKSNGFKADPTTASFKTG